MEEVLKAALHSAGKALMSRLRAARVQAREGGLEVRGEGLRLSLVCQGRASSRSELAYIHDKRGVSVVEAASFASKDVVAALTSELQGGFNERRGL